MLPSFLYDYKGGRPDDRKSLQVKEELERFLEQGYSKKYLDEMIFTKNEAIEALKALGINANTSFYEFYCRFKGVFDSTKGDELYTLDQIIEDAKSGFHSDKYPEIGKRYLQITSIEGEGSYFYDKETDAVYDVNWGEEADMISGKKEPWFNSFYDFLEWYYAGVED